MAMAAALPPFQPISHLPSCIPVPVNNGFVKLRTPVSALTVRNKIADKSTPTPPFCRLRLSVSASSITSDGDRRRSLPRESSASARKSADESEISPDGDEAPNSASQEEIIALLRRIRSSISSSKGETGSGKATSLSSSSKDKSTAESVLGVLRESRKNVRGSRSNKGGKALRWKSRGPKKTQTTPDFKLSRSPSNFIKRSPIPYLTAPREKGLELAELEKAQATPDFESSRSPSNFIKRSPIPYPTTPRGKGLEQNNEEESDNRLKLAGLEKLKLPEWEKTQATPDFKLSRPLSNFIKRSPIPYPTAPRGKSPGQNNEEVSDNGLKLAELEKLRLPELKEAAKARGIKGYSRLKKSELIQLLRS